MQAIWFIQLPVMNITYCINEDHIQLIDEDERRRYDATFYEESLKNMPMRVSLKKCAQPLSVMNIIAKINDDSKIQYLPGAAKGIVLCIQLIENGCLMEFNTLDCMEIDYSKNAVDIRFISADLPFKYRFNPGGTLYRLDIFLPQKEASSLLNKEILAVLDQKRHFAINKIELQAFRKKIETVLRESEKHFNKDRLCNDVDKVLELIKRNFDDNKISFDT